MDATTTNSTCRDVDRRAGQEAGRSRWRIERLSVSAGSIERVVLKESLDSQGFGHFEERRKLLLGDVDLTAVHVLEDGPDLGVLDVLEDDDGVRAGVLQEQRLEVGRASGQHHLVALDRSPADGQRHVRKGFRLQQLLENRQQIRAVIVPAQAILLAVVRQSSRRIVVVVVAAGPANTNATHALGRHCSGRWNCYGYWCWWWWWGRIPPTTAGLPARSSPVGRLLLSGCLVLLLAGWITIPLLLDSAAATPPATRQILLVQQMQPSPMLVIIVFNFFFLFRRSARSTFQNSTHNVPAHQNNKNLIQFNAPNLNFKY